MDSLLAKRLNYLNDQNEALKLAEGQYLLHEAKRKTMEAKIFAAAQGSSVKDREAFVHTDHEYIEFMKELAELETKFNFEKRRFDILTNAFYSEHSTFKREVGLIQKEGVR